MSYDIEAVKRKIAQLSGGNKSGKSFSQAEKLQYFKPAMGINNIRFVPYDHGAEADQPFQQIDYYKSQKLNERRLIAPYQWGLPDPVRALYEELQKDRSNDATWKIMRELRPSESFYAPLVVRGQEDQGIKIWELNAGVLRSIYTKLAHPDFVDEDLFHPEKGFDFTITCTDSGKRTVFNGKEYVVKDYEVDVRRKPSPLAKTKKEREAIVAAVPNLEEHFKQFVMKEEKLNDLVVNFLSADGNSDGEDKGNWEKSDSGETPAATPDSPATKEAASKIDDAFADL